MVWYFLVFICRNYLYFCLWKERTNWNAKIKNTENICFTVVTYTIMQLTRTTIDHLLFQSPLSVWGLPSVINGAAVLTSRWKTKYNYSKCCTSLNAMNGAVLGWLCIDRCLEDDEFFVTSDTKQGHRSGGSATAGHEPSGWFRLQFDPQLSRQSRPKDSQTVQIKRSWNVSDVMAAPARQTRQTAADGSEVGSFTCSAIGAASDGVKCGQKN